MLKHTLLAAFALAAVPSFAQDMMMIDAKTTSEGDLEKYVKMDAYKKLNSPDAYVITRFLATAPGNYKSAVLRGLANVIQESQTLKMEYQMAANARGPMMDEPMMDGSFKRLQRGEREFKMVTMDPLARVSYADVIKYLEMGQNETDRGLIATLFGMKPLVFQTVPAYNNERLLDAVSRYVKANAKATQPYYLKYTSLAPRPMYVSPVIPR